MQVEINCVRIRQPGARPTNELGGRRTLMLWWAPLWWAPLLLALSWACSSKEPAPRGSGSGVIATPSTARAGAGDRMASTPCPELEGVEHVEGARRVEDVEPLATRLPAARRVVAIGDVHGDMRALRTVLALAGAVADSGDSGDSGDIKDIRWTGGDLVIVQTGDILDRGDDEREILDLLARLQEQARASGGAIHLLNGNHEIMNAAWDFRYVTDAGFQTFAEYAGASAVAGDRSALLERVPEAMRGRALAFQPGGPYARRLAHNNVILMIGDLVFVHGGVLAEHAAYGIERINRETRCWLADARATPRDVPASMQSEHSPVWTRRFSVDAPACDNLERALETLGARHMIVGHTPQRDRITSACDERVWRVDIGMSAHYGGPIQALEIRGAEFRVLGR